MAIFFTHTLCPFGHISHLVNCSNAISLNPFSKLLNWFVDGPELSQLIQLLFESLHLSALVEGGQQDQLVEVSSLQLLSLRCTWPSRKNESYWVTQKKDHQNFMATIADKTQAATNGTPLGHPSSSSPGSFLLFLYHAPWAVEASVQGCLLQHSQEGDVLAAEALWQVDVEVQQAS